MKRLLALAALPLFFAMASPAEACKCAQRTRAQVIAESDLVFAGRVLAVRDEGRLHFADVEMIRPLKGDVPRRVEIGTRNGIGSCGVKFRPGQRLDFAVNLRERQYTTSRCSMTPLNARQN
jgi:hypothetical protein